MRRAVREQDEGIVDDLDVELRVAAGELVKMPFFGNPPARAEKIAGLRARVRSYRRKPVKKEP